MRYYFHAFLCLLILAVSSGCASKKPKLEFELVSPEQQMEEVLDQTKPNFQVSFDEDALAWERTRLFFGRYTNKPVISELDPSGDSLKIINSAMEDKYFYEVQRKLDTRAFDYLVRCVPNPKNAKANSLAASKNERNLARFIKEGELQVSLLDR